MEFKHTPIMLKECLDNLNIKSNGIYVDATIGGAGHSLQIAKKLGEDGLLIGFDKDAEAIKASTANLKTSNLKCKYILVNEDFKNYNQALDRLGIKKVDGILIDLGVSSYQIDNAERGFSYVKDAKLDMRMDCNQTLSAYTVINEYSQEKLLKVLYNYGEEDNARTIVKNILLARADKPIETTTELVKIIEKSFPPKKVYSGGSVAKKTFQAIRIEVNGELEGLDEVLRQMISSLSSKGRLCVITFHSLEDRIAKVVFNDESTGCICPKNFPKCVCNHKASIIKVTKKPIVPMPQEQADNSRSTSSKLRVIEKI